MAMLHHCRQLINAAKQLNGHQVELGGRLCSGHLRSTHSCMTWCPKQIGVPMTNLAMRQLVTCAQQPLTISACAYHYFDYRPRHISNTPGIARHCHPPFTAPAQGCQEGQRAGAAHAV